MKKYFKLAGLALAAALTACGGGGGSPGTTQESYSITLRADKTQLPLNIQHVAAGKGAYAPFTTSLYVEAKKGGLPIPGGEDIFGCNVSGGLDSGSLYYLDGEDDHEEEIDDGNGGKIKVPLAYRSITLGANSGGNSFHFHAGNQAGTARITCSVTDPRDSRVHSASVDIAVGGATQKAASVRVIAQAPGYLGSRNNLAGLVSNVAIQAFVMDDANQPVPNSGVPNLQVSIRSGGASGARLIAGNQSGSALHLSTSGGVGLFSLSSGAAAGPIVLEFTADRYDNNVQNGIQDPISALNQVNVMESLTAPLAVGAADLGNVTNGVPLVYALEAEGGLPPYTWVVTGLPAGLMADGSGLITGTPKAPPGIYRLQAKVTDKNKLSASANITLTLVGDPDSINPEDFYINSCPNYGINQACALPPAKSGSSYTYAFTASASGVTWEFSGLPDWLKNGTTGAIGYINGMPTDPCGTSNTYTFLVTAKKGVMSVTRQASIAVATDACPVTP